MASAQRRSNQIANITPAMHASTSSAPLAHKAVSRLMNNGKQKASQDDNDNNNSASTTPHMTASAQRRSSRIANVTPAVHASTSSAPFAHNTGSHLTNKEKQKPSQVRDKKGMASAWTEGAPKTRKRKRGNSDDDNDDGDDVYKGQNDLTAQILVQQVSYNTMHIEYC
jgi:hypothetical protein